jgi:tRNA(Ile)-lysidine synthase
MQDISLLLSKVNLNKKVFIAYSGGVDSTVLLQAFYELSKVNKINLEAIHVNHNLNTQSKLWEAHCKNFCNKRAIKLHTASVKITKKGSGMESAARNERYQIFQNIISNEGQVLTAHHQDDVAETILFRLFRGTGIDGIRGLQEKRKLGKGVLIRPLLSFNKKELEEYATLNKLECIEDLSNHTNEQDRNFIRNELLPLIDSRWTKVTNRINTTASSINTKLGIFNDLFYSAYGSLISDSIPIDGIRAVEREVAIEILRASIRKNDIAMPSRKVIEEILKTFLLSRPGPKSIVSWSRSDKDQPGGYITYKNKTIYIHKS